MKKYLLLFTLAMPLIGLAQNLDIPQKGITVIGSANKSVSPDQAYFRLDIFTQDADVNLAKKLNDDKTARILAYLKSEGIMEDEVQTTSVYFNENYEYYENPRAENRKKSYRSSIQLAFALKDLSKYNRISTKIIELGATNNNVSLQYSKAGVLREQLRIEALKNAKIKAELMAKELSLAVGPAFQIVDEESLSNGHNIYAREEGSMVGHGGGRDAAGILSGGQINIRYFVRVSFYVNHTNDTKRR